MATTTLGIREKFHPMAYLLMLENVAAVAASTRPRAVEGSYMPCFLAGESLGRSVAEVLNVPFFAVSHQQGHPADSIRYCDQNKPGYISRFSAFFHQGLDLVLHARKGKGHILYLHPKLIPGSGFSM